MKSYSAIDPRAGRISYTDRKRYLWWGSVLLPLLPVAAIAGYAATGWGWLLWSPLLVIYGLIPLLDALIGADATNPPEAVVAELEADRYYQWLTWVAVPVHVFVMAGGMWYALTHVADLWDRAALVLSLGFMAALAINTGHELGHKRGRDRPVAVARAARHSGLRTLPGGAQPRPSPAGGNARRQRQFAHG